MPRDTHNEIERRRRALSKICLLGILLWCLTNGTASAHRVSIFAWPEANTVHTISKTSSGKAIGNATVSVLDDDGNHLLEGKTDSEGRFSFETPRKTDLTVVLNAAMGHKAEWKVVAQELDSSFEKGELGSGEERQNQLAQQGNLSLARGQEQRGGSDETDLVLGKRELERLINQALDRKLKPIYALISEAVHDEPGMTEIIGGIGYVFGLIGLALYFASRRKNGGKTS